MTKEQRRFLIIAVIVSFLAATDRLVRFYFDNVPVATVGECIELHFGKRAWKAKIIENSFSKQSSTLLTDDDGFMEKTDISFSELRDLNAEGVSCDEKAN